MSEPVKIVITVQGGMVQNIATMGVPVEALIIDYDCEDADAAAVSQVPQSDGMCGAFTGSEPEPAVISSWAANPLTPQEIEFLAPHWEGA